MPEQTVQPARAKAAMRAAVAWVRGDAREARCVRAASAEAARACVLFFRWSAGFSATLMLSTSSEASLLLFNFGSFGSFDPAQPILRAPRRLALSRQELSQEFLCNRFCNSRNVTLIRNCFSR